MELEWIAELDGEAASAAVAARHAAQLRGEAEFAAMARFVRTGRSSEFGLTTVTRQGGRTGGRPGCRRCRADGSTPRGVSSVVGSPGALQLHLRSPACGAPWSTHVSRRKDADHVTPYLSPDDGGPPAQTSVENLARLQRFAHRVKTHAPPSCRMTRASGGLRGQRDRDTPSIVAAEGFPAVTVALVSQG